MVQIDAGDLGEEKEIMHSSCKLTTESSCLNESLLDSEDDFVLKECDNALSDVQPDNPVLVSEAPTLAKETYAELQDLLHKTSLFSDFVSSQTGRWRETLLSQDNRVGRGEHFGDGKIDQLDNVQQPRLLSGGKIHAYQLYAVQWLMSLYLNGMNGILADEMGLGKTITLIAYLSELWDHGIHGPHLIVVPKTTLTNWVNEFEKWAPSLRVVCYTGHKESRRRIRKYLRSKTTKFSNEISRGFILLTSYSLILHDKSFFHRYQWSVLSVDEAHRLKRFDCLLIRELRDLKTENRVLLTGTPLQNKLSELWSILNFVMPEVFPALQKFGGWFMVDNLEDYSEDKVYATVLHSTQQREAMTRMHHILKPFVLRRLKSQLGISLPPKTELVLRCPFTTFQEACYRAVARRGDSLRGKAGKLGSMPSPKGDNLSSMSKIRSCSLESLNNTLVHLRKVCAHPFLFPSFVQEANKMQIGGMIVENFNPRRSTMNSLKKMWTLDSMFQTCGKLQVFHEIVCHLRKENHKVVVFSQLTSVLDVLCKYYELTQSLSSVLRLDGRTSLEQRSLAISKFQTDACFSTILISTRAGGVGINLQAADTVILYDSDFNPQNDMQAIDRCHRIGQKNHVVVYRLIMEDSVEEYIIARGEQKLRRNGLILDAGRLQPNLSKTRKTSSSEENVGEVDANDITLSLGARASQIVSRSESQTIDQTFPTKSSSFEDSRTVTDPHYSRDELQDILHRRIGDHIAHLGAEDFLEDSSPVQKSLKSSQLGNNVPPSKNPNIQSSVATPKWKTALHNILNESRKAG